MNIVLKARKKIKKNELVKLTRNGEAAPFKRKSLKTIPIGYAVNNSDKNNNVIVYLTCD